MPLLTRSRTVTLLRLATGFLLTALVVFAAAGARAASGPSQDVIVMLNDISTSTSASNAERAAQVRSAVDAVLADHAGSDLLVKYRYRTLLGFSAAASGQAIADLNADSRVSKVMPDMEGQGADSESSALIRATQTQALGFSGEGVTVAVIDSGVDPGNPDFAGAVVHEECFMANPGLSSHCPNGTSYQEGPGAAADDLGHGTNVAGIIAGRGAIGPLGIAPKASLAVYKVIDNSNHFYFSDLTAAIDDILADEAQVHVDILNMSLGTFAAYPPGSCTPDSFFDRIRAAGILAFAASMNSGVKNGMGYPACVGSIVSVGAVYDADFPGFNAGFCSDSPAPVDQVACWSDSDSTLDLLAPGCVIASAGVQSGISSYCGTSQATPHAAGAAAILLEQRHDATPDDIEARLKATGVPRTDPGNGITTPRIDLLAAVSVPIIGDVDCDYRVDGLDVMILLRYSSQLPVSSPGGCPGPGASVGGRLVGDVNCDGAVNTVDALQELQYFAWINLPAGTPQCPAIGEPVP